VSKIEIGRYAERLRRVLGMKGQEMVAGELSAEVSPVIVLEDNAAEWQFLQRVRLCTSVMLQGNVAAQNGLFRLRNPAASGVIAVVNKLGINGTLPFRVSLGYASAAVDLGTPGTTAVRDSRWILPANPTALIASRANNVTISLISSLWIASTLASTLVRYEHGPIIMLPGDVIEWGTSTLNITLETTVDWTERELPALER